jgi:4-amino-4-deoxy-L-arabinose transferase-like glycosyltransferase
LDTRSTQYISYLAALTLLLFFTGLGERDFWAPVEPRYAEIARVMFVKDEWIVPTINGALYSDKPILYFWLVLIVSKLSGVVNEWTVRLPVALAGVGSVLSTYMIGRDFYGRSAGLIAAAVLATCVRVIWEARWAHIDMLFALFFLLAIYFGARALLGKGRKNEILLSYVFMGLAVLAKGLIGVVLPALVFSAYVIVRRDWRLLAEAKLPFGIAIFLLIVAPWLYLVNSATDGKWLADFLYIHHFQRYTHGTGHRQPFYYYFTTLPVDFLPWTVFAIPAAIAYFPYRSLKERPISLLCFLCFAVVFVFFSLSDTKRDLYLLPVLPVLALLVGNYLDDLSATRVPESTLYRWIIQIYFSVVALTGLVLPVVVRIIRPETFWISLPAAFVFAVGGVAVVFFVRGQEPLKVAGAVSLLMALSVICAAMWILPYVEQFKSPRPFSWQIKKIVPSQTPLYIYANTMNDFNYYTQREVIPVLSSPDEVAAVLRRSRNGYLLIQERDLRKFELFGSTEILATDGVGSTRWNLIDLKAVTAR